MSSWIRLGFSQDSIRDWPDGTVVYNQLSGQTHVLNPLAASALELIDAAPISTEQLLASLTPIYADADASALREELDALLQEMSRLGLIAASVEA